MLGGVVDPVAAAAELRDERDPRGGELRVHIALACRALGGDACGDDLVAIAISVRTTGISGAFLLWAARGQALAPVHDVLAAAVVGDLAAAASAARADAQLEGELV